MPIELLRKTDGTSLERYHHGEQQDGNHLTSTAWRLKQYTAPLDVLKTAVVIPQQVIGATLRSADAPHHFVSPLRRGEA